MNSPRILALLPFLAKGALSIEIFRALRARGIEITVVFCKDESVALEPDALEDFQATGDLVDLSAVGTGTKRLRLVQDLIVDRKIDLVVQVGAAELYHLLPYWKERLPDVRIADILYNEFGHTLNHFLYEACMDAVIVESDFMRDFIQRSSLQADRRVVVVHSGVDLDDFSPAGGDGRVGSRLKVGYVGRMADEKNPIGFIELAERLGRLNPALDFEMFGSGPDAALVEGRIARSDMASRLKYHGFVAHSRDALRQLDVLVLPSKFDGRPVTIMEANACGIPVIAAPVGGIPELMSDGVNGFLMSPTETERIHALLSEWQAHPQSLTELKLSARAHALQHFDRQKMIEAYAGAFAKVAAI
ncbi:MAG: glycosyltransferase family 4 protein [Polaromonas sp.]|nr:glycosyltransferase family 4 protein [Polaromonas sp.]